MSEISEAVLEKITERARDPRRRTYTAGVEADATPMDLDAMAEDLRRHGAVGAQALPAAVEALSSLLGAVGGMGEALMMGPEGPMRMGEAPSTELDPSPDAGALARAEAVIGRPLPQGLRQLYAIGDGGFGPGQGLFRLEALMMRYAQNRREPFGPMGQAWPGQLLPVCEDRPVLTCVDLDTGVVVVWDPEELEDLESEADWARSFRTEHPSLEAWMQAWLASPVFGE